MRKALDEYLALTYPLRLTPDPDGGYIFEFPDLPGCMGQIDTLEELAEHANEALTLWLEVAYERGREIPVPSGAEEYSGKFLVRISKSLHRQLVATAQSEGVSLNAYVTTILASGHVWGRVEPCLEELKAAMKDVRERLQVSYEGKNLHPSFADYSVGGMYDDLDLAA